MLLEFGSGLTSTYTLTVLNCVINMFGKTECGKKSAWDSLAKKLLKCQTTLGWARHVGNCTGGRTKSTLFCPVGMFWKNTVWLQNCSWDFPAKCCYSASHSTGQHVLEKQNVAKKSAWDSLAKELLRCQTTLGWARHVGNCTIGKTKSTLFYSVGMFWKTSVAKKSSWGFPAKCS